MSELNKTYNVNNLSAGDLIRSVGSPDGYAMFIVIAVNVSIEELVRWHEIGFPRNLFEGTRERMLVVNLETLERDSITDGAISVYRKVS